MFSPVYSGNNNVFAELSQQPFRYVIMKFVSLQVIIIMVFVLLVGCSPAPRYTGVTPEPNPDEGLRIHFATASLSSSGVFDLTGEVSEFADFPKGCARITLLTTGSVVSRHVISNSTGAFQMKATNVSLDDSILVLSKFDPDESLKMSVAHVLKMPTRPLVSSLTARDCNTPPPVRKPCPRLVEMENSDSVQVPARLAQSGLEVPYRGICKRAAVSGVVELAFAVQADGKTDSIRLTNEIGGECDQAALAAIVNATFEPAVSFEGAAVYSHVRASIAFGAACQE